MCNAYIVGHCSQFRESIVLKESRCPIVIHSLEVGTKEVRIAAAWELCRMASSNQWSQIEIYECGGVTALLGYLKARPGADGIQVHLTQNPES